MVRYKVRLDKGSCVYAHGYIYVPNVSQKRLAETAAGSQTCGVITVGFGASRLAQDASMMQR